MILLITTLISCGQGEVKIDLGNTECAHCRMTVVDGRSAAAVVTRKGRQYVFDDLACMVAHVESGAIAEDQVAHWYVCDHSEPGKLIDATTAYYAHGSKFRSPMRGDMAAFGSEQARAKATTEGEAEKLDWNAAREQLKK